jgi:hypothetical protein
MAKKNTSGVALDAGDSGIVGHAVAKELKRQGWTICSLVRQPIEGMDTIPVELTDREAAASALEACRACPGEADRGDD